MLFFLPNVKAIAPGVLASHGLDRVIEKPVSRETFRGPFGKQGLLVCDDRDATAEQLAFDDSQTWMPRAGFDSSICILADRKPTPATLARSPHGLSTVGIEMLDGNQWEIPVLRQWRSIDSDVFYVPRLPRVLVRNTETSRWIPGKVIPKYRKLWETACTIAESVFSQLATRNTASVDDSQYLAFVTELLQVGYRVDDSVIEALELLSETHPFEIFRASIDWEQMETLLKNSTRRQACGDSNSESGPMPPIAESTIPIDQPSRS